MTAYILKRIALLVPTLLGLSLLAFSIIHIVPGDPVEVMLSDRASPEAVERLQHELGYDQPVLVQYARWLGRAVQGDLGQSVISREPVAEQFLHRLPATVELALVAILFAVAVGIPLGVVSATRRGTLVDYVSWGIALAGVSMPIFWLELLLIWVFAVSFQLLPISARVPFDLSFTFHTEFYLFESLFRGRLDVFLTLLRHLALPAFALSMWPTALLTRMTRSAMLDVLGQQYIRTARSKGMTERKVIYKHALRNAMMTILTMVGLALGSLLSGAVVTESVFAWPGVGLLMIQSISTRDYPQLQGLILLIAIMIVLINITVDVLYGWVDPRVRYE